MDYSQGLPSMIAGQRQNWRLLDKIGEGDAGEVYLVESLVDRERAILKRPARSALAADQIRQASQIKNEGRVLQALETLSVSGDGFRVCTPALIDQDILKTNFNSEVFIVIEAGAGFDLRTLAKGALLGAPVQSDDEVYSSQQQRVFEHIQSRKIVPELIVLRSLAGLYDFLLKVHSHELELNDRRYAGLLWNDVKPEHLFWEPASGTLTIIDWGNAQLLEPDGGSTDRRFSRRDDANQFIQSMGDFLKDAAPALLKGLKWSSFQTGSWDDLEALQPLRQRIAEALQKELEVLGQIRREEEDLVFQAASGLEALDRLAEIQERLLDIGEVPNPQTVALLHSRLAIQLANEGRLTEFQDVCRSALLIHSDPAGDQLPLSQSPTQDSASVWKLEEALAGIALEAGPDDREAVLSALKFGVNGDWPAAFWTLLLSFEDGSIPGWWEDISRMVRRVHLGLDEAGLLPYNTVSRAYYTLQAAVMKNGTGNHPDSSSEQVLRMLEVEILPRWKDPEPDPPFSGITYADIESLYNDLDLTMPGLRSPIEQALEQAKAQATNVLEAWQGKNFETARRALRLLLLHDPQRRRVLLADRAISRAPGWLARVRAGARKGETLVDYSTQVELEGRELRNQVGPAPWLDTILEAFKKLRSQVRPADLMMEQPELLAVIPWLNEYSSQETIHLPHTHPLSLERGQENGSRPPTIAGIHEARLGSGEEVALGEPADTWAPEATGSSARVFDAEIKDSAGNTHNCVIKIMRPDKAEYALPLFQEEAKILTTLRDVRGINRLLECGFLKLSGEVSLPRESQRKGGAGLQGMAVRYGINDVQTFLSSIEERAAGGWLPYLALEKMNPKHNLLVFCDYGHTHGRFLPLRESLLLAIQICDILQAAHDRNIAYRDHKILHYYWNERAQAVMLIDWNIARRFPQGLSPADRQFDIVQFGARALHHIFTGRSAPGSLPLGGNLLQDVEQAAHEYTPMWTYDDERLPNPVKEIIERVLAGEYLSIHELRQDLLKIFQQISAQADIETA